MTAITLDDGLVRLREQIDRMSKLLNNDFKGAAFSRADNMQQYTLVYRMCTQPPPLNFAQQLHDEHGRVCMTLWRGVSRQSKSMSLYRLFATTLLSMLGQL
jgi:hypothetical protein